MSIGAKRYCHVYRRIRFIGTIFITFTHLLGGKESPYLSLYLSRRYLTPSVGRKREISFRELWDREGNTQPSPSKYVNFIKPIFRPIKRLKVIGSWSPERSSNVYSVLSREKSTATIITFCTVSFETVARGLGDFSNNRLKCADVSGNTLSFNYNL